MCWCAVKNLLTHSLTLHVLFGLPLGLEPSTSYSIHFITQSVSSFRSTCPYHRNLFCCSINIISSIHSLSLNFLLGTLSFTLTLHIHLTILISACWSATSFSFPTGQVSLSCRTFEKYSSKIFHAGCWYCWPTNSVRAVNSKHYYYTTTTTTTTSV